MRWLLNIGRDEPVDSGALFLVDRFIVGHMTRQTDQEKKMRQTMTFRLLERRRRNINTGGDGPQEGGKREI